MNEGEAVLHLLLVGTGSGDTTDMEKAGAAIGARLLTSGVVHAAVEGAGYDAGALAHLALAAQLRAWRIDTHRTKLTDKQKPSLATLTLVSEADGLADRLADMDALASGVMFTRELVAEPGNIIYPESFVARCQELAALGIEISVLDENDMAALGMGALLGVAQGSIRKPRLLALRWDGTAVRRPNRSALSARASRSTPAASRSSPAPAWKT